MLISEIEATKRVPELAPGISFIALAAVAVAFTS
jgi:hypothetical protein